ncbi:MAG TPA: hypothetical protein PLY73_14380 [Candidatus Ozemobacteraceae bacterium]|nr:hypothetical protein [Candidatus Ozemobacteraceae bacterium]
MLADHRIDGTPFAPFALLVEELLDAEETGDFATLERIELVQPLMLRRDRPKTARLHSAPVSGPVDGSREAEGARIVELLDDVGAAFIRGRFLQPSARPSAGISQPGADVGNPAFGEGSLKLPRADLYPGLLFHGPTFQADFTIGKAEPGSLLVRLSGLAAVPSAPDRLSPTARRAVVAGDLALQAASLHAMSLVPEPIVPWGCGLYARFVNVGAGDSLLVRARRLDDGRYDIDVMVETGEKPTPYMFWRNVEFRAIRAALSEKARTLLANIRRT